jgi:hypothetical protein
MIGAVVHAEDFFGTAASWGRMLAVGCGSRAARHANSEATWVGRGGMVDCKELVSRVSCCCEMLHDCKEMSFGPIGVRARGRDDEDRLGNHTLTIPSFLLNSFHIALAMTALIIL